MSHKAHTVFISIGSNMGNKTANCRNAIDAVETAGIGAIAAISPFYESEPVDYTDQEWFLNAALKIETPKAPLELLSALQQIQVAAGRKGGGIRFGPRILDLDIIFYDNIIFKHKRLVIPHPRMHLRRFVLQPVCDIDPQIRHPEFGQTVAELLDQISPHGQGIFRYLCAF